MLNRRCSTFAAARPRHASATEHPQGHPPQAHLGADVRRHAGAGALARRGGAGRAGGVLPRRLRDRAGGGDLRVAQRAEGRRAHQAAARACRPRPDRPGRHVLQFRVAGAAAARRGHRDLVRRTADHGGARRHHPEGARAHLPLVGGRRRLPRRARDAGAAFRRRAAHRRPYVDADARRDPGAHRGLLQCRRRDPDAPAHRHRDHLVDRVLLLARLRASAAC